MLLVEVLGGLIWSGLVGLKDFGGVVLFRFFCVLSLVVVFLFILISGFFNIFCVWFLFGFLLLLLLFIKLGGFFSFLFFFFG